MESVHVERQVVELTFVVGNGTVGIAVEGHYLVHVVPYLAVGGVEDMCAVFMHIDACDLLAIDVAAEMRTLVDDQASLALAVCLSGKHCSEQPGAHYQIIVFFHNVNLSKHN